MGPTNRNPLAWEVGHLWEHCVLNEIHAATQTRDVHFWRDKRGHEMDFVWVRRARPPLGIECKWSADHFKPEGAQAFARAYPQAEIVVVAQDVERTHRRKLGDAEVTFLALPRLIERLMA